MNTSLVGNGGEMEIDTSHIWRVAYWLYPTDMNKRLDYFEMRVRQEMIK